MLSTGNSGVMGLIVGAAPVAFVVFGGVVSVLVVSRADDYALFVSNLEFFKRALGMANAPSMPFMKCSECVCSRDKMLSGPGEVVGCLVDRTGEGWVVVTDCSAEGSGRDWVFCLAEGWGFAFGRAFWASSPWCDTFCELRLMKQGDSELEVKVDTEKVLVADGDGRANFCGRRYCRESCRRELEVRKSRAGICRVLAEMLPMMRAMLHSC